jgi:hypothetical protein
MSLNRQSKFPIFQAADFFEVTPSDTLDLVYDPANRTGSLHTVTIARSGNIATVTDTAHGFSTGDRIVVRGANQAEYNGIKKITVVNANSFTFLVAGEPATPATGTITTNLVNYDRVSSVFVSRDDNAACTVSVISAYGKTATFRVPSGTYLPIVVKRVLSTGTTADTVIALIGN